MKISPEPRNPKMDPNGAAPSQGGEKNKWEEEDLGEADCKQLGIADIFWREVWGLRRLWFGEG